jgi:predicted dehydrogenase
MENKMQKSVPQNSRRNFLKKSLISTAMLGFPSIVPRTVFGKNAPSNRIALGFIGCGKQGRHLLKAFLNEPYTQVVCLSDVDRLKLKRNQKIALDYYANNSESASNPDIQMTGDYQELLARPDIDAAVISTPDHWHGLNVIDAAKAGKDIYCEKPLAHNINEGKAMVDAVRRYDRVFQTGSMQRSNARFYNACMLVRNGYIGDIKHVAVNVGGPPVPCNLASFPVPSYLDWDRWLGPAKQHPYNSELSPHISVDVFPNWRGYKEYGGGSMTDWGAHHFDIAQWGLGMDGNGPIKVIPPNGKDIKDLTYVYANGITMSRSGNYDGMGVNGVLFVGTKGKVMVNRSYFRTWPENLISHIISPDEIQLYKSQNHYADFLNATHSRQQPICDIKTGNSSVVVCLMGNIAYELNRPLDYNQETQSFTNDDEANKLLGRSKRDTWKI